MRLKQKQDEKLVVYKNIKISVANALKNLEIFGLRLNGAIFDCEQSDWVQYEEIKLKFDHSFTDASISELNLS